MYIPSSYVEVFDPKNLDHILRHRGNVKKKPDARKHVIRQQTKDCESGKRAGPLNSKYIEYGNNRLDLEKILELIPAAQFQSLSVDISSMPIYFI